jgi:hypothetical protein
MLILHLIHSQEQYGCFNAEFSLNKMHRMHYDKTLD